MSLETFSADYDICASVLYLRNRQNDIGVNENVMCHGSAARQVVSVYRCMSHVRRKARAFEITWLQRQVNNLKDSSTWRTLILCMSLQDVAFVRTGGDEQQKLDVVTQDAL